MFKSSFLNITNSLRPLNQRKTYTTGKDDYVESYINEVKPFHTKIREYKLKYTNSETHDGINTDFDLPPFYESAQAKTRPPQPGTILDETLLTTYPYKMWKDHYTKHVKSLTITNLIKNYKKPNLIYMDIEGMESSIIKGNLNLLFKLCRSGIPWPLGCLLYTSPSPREKRQCSMPSSA